MYYYTGCLSSLATPHVGGHAADQCLSNRPWSMTTSDTVEMHQTCFTNNCIGTVGVSEILL